MRFGRRGEHTNYEVGKTASGLIMTFNEEGTPCFDIHGYMLDKNVMRYKVTKDFPEYTLILKAFIQFNTTDKHPDDIFDDMVKEIIN